MSLFLKALALSLLTEGLLIFGGSLIPPLQTVAAALHWPGIFAITHAMAWMFEDVEGPRLFPLIVLLNIPTAVALWLVPWWIILKVMLKRAAKTQAPKA